MLNMGYNVPLSSGNMHSKNFWMHCLMRDSLHQRIWILEYSKFAM